MPFSLPEGLAPEVYPLAWLVGSWRGEGMISYPGIEESAFVQDVTFDHDGGPYLRYESTIRLLDPAVPDEVPDAWPEGTERADAPEPTVWSTETGYWRVAPERPEGLPEGKTPLEVLLADPAGRVSLYLGAVGNGRVDLVSDLIARTATSAEVSASNRLYGLVEGRLMWVWEIAAFGHPRQSYVSANLARLEA